MTAHISPPAVTMESTVSSRCTETISLSLGRPSVLPMTAILVLGQWNQCKSQANIKEHLEYNIATQTQREPYPQSIRGRARRRQRARPHMPTANALTNCRRPRATRRSKAAALKRSPEQQIHSTPYSTPRTANAGCPFNRSYKQGSRVEYPVKRDHKHGVAGADQSSSRLAWPRSCGLRGAGNCAGCGGG